MEVTDWSNDPWSRGGYSSVPVGGHMARASLAERAGRLVFAGETTDTDGEAGTVSGAIRSGERAAEEARTLLSAASDTRD